MTMTKRDEYKGKCNHCAGTMAPKDCGPAEVEAIWINADGVTDGARHMVCRSCVAAGSSRGPGYFDVRPYGNVMHGAVTVYLTQEAYPETLLAYGQPQIPIYRARGLGDDGERYMVVWEQLRDSEDASEACDWDRPYSIEQC